LEFFPKNNSTKNTGTALQQHKTKFCSCNVGISSRILSEKGMMQDDE